MSSRIQEPRPTGESAPVMVAQNVIAAAVLCIGEVIAAPLYMIIVHGGIALVPWMMVACMLAVAFCATAGFALLWLAQSLVSRMSGVHAVVVYAVTGFVGFGLWGFLVVVSLIDSLTVAQGLAALVAGQALSVAFNSAVWGFLGYGGAQAVGERFARHRRAVYVTGAVLVIVAAVGLFYAVSMFSVVY